MCSNECMFFGEVIDSSIFIVLYFCIFLYIDLCFDRFVLFINCLSLPCYGYLYGLSVLFGGKV